MGLLEGTASSAGAHHGHQQHTCCSVPLLGLDSQPSPFPAPGKTEPLKAAWPLLSGLSGCVTTSQSLGPALLLTAHRPQLPLPLWAPVCYRPPLNKNGNLLLKETWGLNIGRAGIRVHHPQPTQRPGIILSFPSPTFPTAQLFGAPEGLPPKFVLTPSLLLSLRLLDSRLSSLGASHLFPVCSQ